MTIAGVDTEPATRQQPPGAPEAPDGEAGGARSDHTTRGRSTGVIRRRRADLFVIAVFLLGGFWVTLRLWPPERMVTSYNDEVLFEWMLAAAARAVTHLDNPLFSARLNAPAGVNLMGNTSVLGIGIPLTPVTVLAGPHVSFVLALALSLGGTAIAWYLLMSRTLGMSRLAAGLGGALCGFAPGMVSQSSGHLHMTAQWLVPAIVWAVLRLRGPGRVVPRGAVLGILVAYQVFLGEEVLVLAGLGLGCFLLFYVAFRPAVVRSVWRGFTGGVAVALAVAGALLAYPLWFQFFGPQSYRGLPFGNDSYWTDLATYGAHTPQTISGFGYIGGPLAPNPSEENSFYGYALLGLGAVIAIWLWRLPSVKALALSVPVFALLAAGPELSFNGASTGVPGPYRLLADLPVFDLAVPARYSLVITPMLAVLLARSIDAMPRTREVPVRALWAGAVAAVLVPLVPIPMTTVDVPPVPEFISSGEWRRYVPPGRNLVPVVPTTGGNAIWGMYWSARTGLAFTAPGGYFIGPSGTRDSQARWGSPDTRTSILLDKVAFTGQVPQITDAQRAQALADLRTYRGAVVVLGEMPHEGAVRRTLEALLGPGRFISGAWVWDIRQLVG